MGGFDKDARVEIGGVSKVGMIQDIECFRSELQTHAFRKVELSPQGQVQLPVRKTPERIAGKVSVLA